MKLEDLKEGMYIRTYATYNCNMVCIRKIGEIDEGLIYIDEDVTSGWGEINYTLVAKDIELASFNILDVIKIGDYVNGYKVTNGYYDKNGKIDKIEVLEYINYFSSEINSVLTKEEYEQISYHVGE